MSNFTPAWFKKGFFNESLFCDDFLSTHQLIYSNGAFFTPDGRMTDTMPLRCEIFEMMREYVGANLAKKVTNVVDSACSYRLTHGPAPQQADAEPVHCFIATDSWSMPLSSKGIIYHSCGIARQNWFTYNKTLDTSGLYWMER